MQIHTIFICNIWKTFEYTCAFTKNMVIEDCYFFKGSKTVTLNLNGVKTKMSKLKYTRTYTHIL